MPVVTAVAERTPGLYTADGKLIYAIEVEVDDAVERALPGVPVAHGEISPGEGDPLLYIEDVVFTVVTLLDAVRATDYDLDHVVDFAIQNLDALFEHGAFRNERVLRQVVREGTVVELSTETMLVDAQGEIDAAIARARQHTVERAFDRKHEHRRIEVFARTWLEAFVGDILIASPEDRESELMGATIGMAAWVSMKALTATEVVEALSDAADDAGIDAATADEIIVAGMQAVTKEARQWRRSA